MYIYTLYVYNNRTKLGQVNICRLEIQNLYAHTLNSHHRIKCTDRVKVDNADFAYRYFVKKSWTERIKSQQVAFAHYLDTAVSVFDDEKISHKFRRE